MVKHTVFFGVFAIFLAVQAAAVLLPVPLSSNTSLHTINFSESDVRSEGCTCAPYHEHDIKLDCTDVTLDGHTAQWIFDSLNSTCKATITRFMVINSNVVGTIPVALSTMTQLTALMFQDYSAHPGLHGTIPAQLSVLTNLGFLDLEGNSFKGGTVPAQLSSLTKLEYLRLARSQLGGAFPKEYSTLTRLTYLNVESNPLSTIIPSEISCLTALKSLMFDGIANLTGTIPAEMDSLTSLSALYLSNTHLSGRLPVSFTSLTRLASMTLKDTLIEPASCRTDCPNPFVQPAIRCKDVIKNCTAM